MREYLLTQGLSVGYNGRSLLDDLNLTVEKGTVLTLIGPNGAGKSTILKTITKQLSSIGGTVILDGKDLNAYTNRDLASRLAVMLTERLRPELITCAEIVAMGRYPYTNMFGRLTAEDISAVEEALEMVHASELADRDFSTLSDGQRQRILLARAICQQPEILILDEPTAYLDVRHKIELLDILRKMAKEKQTAIVMSLHEIDLAMKVSDLVLCVKADGTTVCGSPEEIAESCPIEELYGITTGSYNPLFGSVELGRTGGTPEIFIVGGGGYGIAFYRQLQKRGIPFAAGILFENDIDYQVASVLGEAVVSVPPFRKMEKEHFERAGELMLNCKAVIDAGTPVGELNEMNAELLRLAAEKKIPVYTELK